MLPVSVAVLMSLALRALGQEPQPWPKTVSIDSATPLTQPLQFRSAGSAPLSETSLELKGNGQEWSFVQFDKLPANTSLKTNDQPDGYIDSEEIQPDKWYWFKNKLPLVLVIKSSAQTPVTVSFRFGRPSDNDKTLTNSIGPIEMRVFTETHQFTKDSLTQILVLTWDAPVVTKARTSPYPVPMQASEPSPTDLWQWLRIVLGLVVVIAVVMAGIALWWFLSGLLHVRLTRNRMRMAKARKPPPKNKTLDYFEIAYTSPTNQSDVTKVTDAPICDTGIAQSSRALTESIDTSNRPAGSFPGDSVTPRRKKKPSREEFRSSSTLDDVSYPPPKSQAPTSTKPENVPVKNAAPTSPPVTSAMRHDFELLRQEVINLSIAIDEARAVSVTQKRLDEELNQLLEMQVRFREQLNQLKQLGDNAEQRLTKLLETEIRRLRRDLLKSINEQQAEFRNELEERNEWREKKSADNINGLRIEVNEVSDKLNQLRESNGQTEALDSFYARTLGTFLAQNIETLRDGNFEQLAQQLGERLNQFFRTEVPHGAQLLELRQHCEAVNSALQDVVVQMAKLNPKAAEEATPHLQRSAALAAEVASLQSQLQSRRLIIDTTLRIPISAYSGARQTFTDELGRGIKHEIDKLSEPQKHFAAELKRLTTTDVIAVVDICDKEISHPGVRPDLEAALIRLFKHAGLRHIVPRSGEPLKAVEHDMIETVQNGSGRSSGIAHVVKRGFFSDHEDDKTLLRKAGVAVYR